LICYHYSRQGTQLEKEMISMVKVTYVFNDGAIKQAGTTRDNLLENIRNFVAHRDGATEPEYGVFTLDKDENDLTLLFQVMDELEKNAGLRNMFKAVYCDVDGEISDCIDTINNFKIKI